MPIAPPALTPDQPARERILWTACALFYRDGVRATGIDRVIAEAGVTKVTFYRHFPSKNDLVLAFLADRHTRWMQWFDAALQRHGNTPDALVPALAEWLEDADFRGCAFLNTSAELGGSLDGVNTLTRQHKSDVARRIEALMPQAGSAGPHAVHGDGRRGHACLVRHTARAGAGGPGAGRGPAARGTTAQAPCTGNLSGLAPALPSAGRSGAFSPPAAPCAQRAPRWQHPHQKTAAAPPAYRCGQSRRYPG